MNLSDFTTVCGMVAAGLGVALVPTLALPPQPGWLRSLAIKGDPVARHVWAARRPGPTGEHATLLTDALACLQAAADD